MPDYTRRLPDDLAEERADARQWDRDHPWVSAHDDDTNSRTANDAYERDMDERWAS